MKKLFFVFCPIFLSLILGCTADVVLQQNPDDSVSISFKGVPGKAVSQLIQEFDTAATAQALEEAGFAGVKVLSSPEKSVSVTMTEPHGKTYLFTSGIVRTDSTSLSVRLSRKSLSDFYDSADSQTAALLDLFLAPVFNDEHLDEAEYTDLLAAVYGETVAQEIKDSVLSVTLIHKNGKRTVRQLPFAALLVLEDMVSF